VTQVPPEGEIPSFRRVVARLFPERRVAPEGPPQYRPDVRRHRGTKLPDRCRPTAAHHPTGHEARVPADMRNAGPGVRHLPGSGWQWGRRRPGLCPDFRGKVVSHPKACHYLRRL
jgi:hypothetical protein